MWRPTISSDELWHHGILGQKWGEQNGPPYPLGSSDHSAKEKKRGWKASLSAKNSKKRKKQLAKMYKEERKKQTKANIKEYARSIKKTAKKHPVLTVAALSSNQPEFLLLANHLDKKKKEKRKTEKEKQREAKKPMASRHEYRQLKKQAKYKEQLKDWKEFSRMTPAEFKKEYQARDKAARRLMDESFTKSKTRGEQIAKELAAETAFNNFAKMYAYEKSLEKIRQKEWASR